MRRFFFLFCGLLGVVAVANAQPWDVGVPPNESSVTASVTGSGNSQALTITGTDEDAGVMKDFVLTGQGDKVPWNNNNIIDLFISNVVHIGDYAFTGASKITSVTIPGEVTSIGDYAFSGCSDLTTVTVKRETAPAAEDNVFSNPMSATLIVPEHLSQSVYGRGTDYWCGGRDVERRVSTNHQCSRRHCSRQMITNPDETIRLERLPAGVYFFRVEKDGQSKTLKIIKN